MRRKILKKKYLLTQQIVTAFIVIVVAIGEHICSYLGEISIPHKLGFSEISPPQSLLPSNAQILNLMLINLFIIVFILLVIHCVWQNNKINK